MSRPRILVAGLGDTGLLTAIHLSRHAEVVGISAKPGLVSGQELGLRLTRPQDWKRDYWVAFDRYRALAGVRTLHGRIDHVDLSARKLTWTDPTGFARTEPYDVLIISTGVTNGFWRRPGVETEAEVEESLRAAHERLATASSIAVIGGGAAAVSSALNTATTWPGARVDLYFPGERALPQYHGKVWATLQKRLRGLGVGVHPGHRAVVPAGFDCDEITAGPAHWSTGQEPADADAVLWTIGRVRPNTDWLPAEVLDADGFVRVDQQLRVLQADGAVSEGVYAIGDVASTDPLRNSARSRADHLLAHNVRAGLTGGALKTFKPAPRRWGSVVGEQRNGLDVFTVSGQSFRIPAWRRLQPLIVGRGIYKGIRRA